MSDFTSIPIIDFSLAKTNKPLFLSQLRHALINVGFLYLSNSSVDPSLVKNLKAYLDPLFALPQDVKDGIKMSNSQHFLGYTKLGAEFTKGSLDQREQFDFATQHQCRWAEGEEDFVRLWGEGQWPPESLVPGFRKTFLDYFSAVADLSYSFASLTAEALGLHPDALNKFYDEPRREMMQHRGKIARYPPAREGQSSQGVGAHFDPGFLTFLVQMSPHVSLQVQNHGGDWINVPPMDNTFIVNIGKGLETVTRKVALATSHRVVSPAYSPKIQGARYSVVFFQSISQKVKLADELLDFPKEITALRDARDIAAGSKAEPVNYTEYDKAPAGLAELIGRIKSHPDVAERHYPGLFSQFFPTGLVQSVH